METRRETFALSCYDPQDLGGLLQLVYGPGGDPQAALANASCLPKSLRGKPADLLMTVMAGRELGIGTIASLRGIYIVEGKVTLSADLMAALVQRSGLCEQWHVLELTPTTCTVASRRVGDTDKAIRKTTWTIEMARTAGLTGKDPWKKYPHRMLKARAAMDHARDHYPEVAFGCYDPDEIPREESQRTRRGCAPRSTMDFRVLPASEIVAVVEEEAPPVEEQATIPPEVESMDPETWPALARDHLAETHERHPDWSELVRIAYARSTWVGSDFHAAYLAGEE